MSLNIVGTQYTLENKVLELFIAGCKANPRCDGCHNPELWESDVGTTYDKKFKKVVLDKVNSFSHMIDNLWVTGGEPLDQDIKILKDFIKDLKTTKKKVWLFTRYGIDEIPLDILELCDYVKCGRYIKENKTEDHYEHGVLLATDNQHVFKKGKDYS